MATDDEDFDTKPTLPPRKIKMADPIVPPPPERKPRQRSLTPYAVKRWAKAHNVLQTVWQTLGILGVIGASVWGYLQSFSTDEERDKAIQKVEVVNTRQDKSLEQLTAQLREVEGKQTRLRRQVIMLWRDRVSFRAAEREPLARLRAAASAYYREEYDRVINRGQVEPDEAARQALRATWYERSRLLRRR